MRGRILVGIVLVVAGVAWILDLAGHPLFPGGFGTWWPLLLVLLGVAQLVSWPWGWTGGLFLILLGGLLQLWRLGVLGGDWWMYLIAAGIVFAGVSMLTSPWRRRRWRERWGAPHEWAWAGPRRYHHAGRAAGDEAVFSNLARTFDGEFKGAELRSVFGALRVDMTRATLPPEGARLALGSIFGSVDVRVPAEWRVEVHGSPVGGRIHNGAAAGSGPTLTVECEAVFGNVEIGN